MALRAEDEEPIRIRRRKILHSLHHRCCDFRRRNLHQMVEEEERIRHFSCLSLRHQMEQVVRCCNFRRQEMDEEEEVLIHLRHSLRLLRQMAVVRCRILRRSKKEQVLVEVQDEEELIRNHHCLHRKILKPPLLWLPPPYTDSIRRCFRNLRQMVDEEERIHIHHLRRRKEFVVEVLYEEEEPIHSRRQIEEVLVVNEEEVLIHLRHIRRIRNRTPDELPLVLGFLRSLRRKTAEMEMIRN